MAGRPDEQRKWRHYRQSPTPMTDRDVLAYFAGRRLARLLPPDPFGEMPHPRIVEDLLTDDERLLRSTMSPSRWLACLLYGWSDEREGR